MQFVAIIGHEEHEVPLGVASVPTLLIRDAPHAERTIDAYSGYGTWVDRYDYAPSTRSRHAKVTVASIDDMARHGVGTLYVQAARYSQDTSSLLIDPALLGQLLVRSHRAGMKVIGWYLPEFADIERDLEHLEAISNFEVLGHRFDGVAVDIEWTNSVTDHAERSAHLVTLSQRLRDVAGDDALGAIVLPPVQIEVVNSNKWPDFPWRQLSDLYDVWLPMGYWTERKADSGYKDGYTYTMDNLTRLRVNLGDSDAAIHAVGGIGDGVTSSQATRFAQALMEQHAIGGSIYDWTTLDPTVNDQLAEEIRPRTRS